MPSDDLSTVQEIGRTFPVEWVPVPDPAAGTTSTRRQFNHPAFTDEEGATTPARTDAAAITRSQKLEGAWWGDGNAFFITVSPYGGGVVIAEDGEGEQHLVALADDGRPFAFARNALNIADPPDPSAPEPAAEYSEFAGVTFSDDGRTLFANCQTPGITYAITGPWQRIWSGG